METILLGVELRRADIALLAYSTAASPYIFAEISNRSSGLASMICQK